MRRLLALAAVLSWLLAWHATPGDLRSAAGQGASKQPQDKKHVEAELDEPKHKGPLKYRLVGPAAGGRISRACGVPGDPSTYYLAAASGGVWKSQDGGITWKSIFDDQPTSSMGAIAVAPSDPNVVYAGSGEANIRGNVQPGDGIHRSTNGGKTWQHVWKQKGQIGRIIVHPTNPDVAYAAVLGSPFQKVKMPLIAQPGSHDRSVNNAERGVYRTTDGGRTWQQILKHKVPAGAARVYPKGDKVHNLIEYAEHVGAIDVCFDPRNPRILLAALWQTHRTPWSLTSGGSGSGIYHSEDGGDSWKKLGPNPKEAHDDDDGLPEGPWGRVGLAFAPSDSRRVYALIEADKGGLYRSDDGGESWKLASGGHYLRQRAWYFSQLAVDPHHPDVVWCSNVRLLKSIDGGKTFKNVKGPHHVDHHDLWIDPKDPRRMIDSNDGGVDITTNGGETWHAPALPLCQFYHIHADNGVPYRVMGTMQDVGTASGPSNSLLESGIPLSEWHPVGGGETGFVVPDPTDPNVVYAGEYGGYLSRYDRRTRQAVNVSVYPINPSGKAASELRYRFQWTAPVMISPHDPKTLYHAANVLFRSRNGGQSWTQVSVDLTRNDRSKQQWSGGPITGDNTGAETYDTIFALAESPKQPGVLWAGSDDGLVHVSLDDAKTWTEVTKNIAHLPEWGTVNCIEASPHEAGTAYVVVHAYRLDDDRPYLWKTTDFGKTWTSLSAGLPEGEFLYTVREDPQAAGLLYAGGAHHVWWSHDGGKSWEALKLNLPTAPITDLVVKGGDLVVATSGRSVWILDDLTPLRQWAKKQDGPHLFTPPPATLWRYQGDDYAGDAPIKGDNPPHGAIINYYLPKKSEKPLRLEVYDAAGKKVRTLTSKKEEDDDDEDEDSPDAPWSEHKPVVLGNAPGVHRIAWDLRYEKPTAIPKAKNDAGPPREGPYVLPGSYTLKLHVDGHELVGQVEVRLDPRVKISAEALRERHRLALQVYDDVTKLSRIVIALRSVREQIKQRVKLEPRDAKWVKEADALLPKLDALEEQLHNPKAEVTYDILAMKGGAKLYSQLVPLYRTLTESDAALTQGVRTVYAEQAKELHRLDKAWQDYVNGEIAQLNEQGRGMPALVVPKSP